MELVNFMRQQHHCTDETAKRSAAGGSARSAAIPGPSGAWRRRWQRDVDGSFGALRSRHGTTATPKPAATSPSIVGISVASNTMSGSMPASAHSSSVSCRSPYPGLERDERFPAAAASRIRVGRPDGGRGERPDRAVRRTARASRSRVLGRGEVIARSACPSGAPAGRSRAPAPGTGRNRSPGARCRNRRSCSGTYQLASECRKATAPYRCRGRAGRRCARWPTAFRRWLRRACSSMISP